jgi:hypothetical protein
LDLKAWAWLYCGWFFLFSSWHSCYGFFLPGKERLKKIDIKLFL